MRLLEHEAKQLLSGYGMPIPSGQLVVSKSQPVTIPFPLIIKAQVPAGGRGKAGGIITVFTHSELTEAVNYLFTNPVLGYQSSAVLAEQALEIRRELYLAITIDRTSRDLVLLAHRQGGIDIESAVHDSEMLRLPITDGINSDTQHSLLEYFGLTENFRQPLAEIVEKLRSACVHEDAVLVEINPLVVTNDNHLICADAKIELDDAAGFRHDWNFQQPTENTQFVVLNRQGTVGSIANGAGLAMATVDAIKASGAEPANFLDIGGGTDSNAMVLAFRRIGELPNIKAIVVNIFGGITHCDEVAHALVQARTYVPNLPPLFIRLTGTNEERGRAILKEAGIPILPDLKSCVEALRGIV